MFHYFSGVDLKKSSFTNHSVGENASRNHEICAMSWNDDNENQVLLASHLAADNEDCHTMGVDWIIHCGYFGAKFKTQDYIM